MPEKPMGGVDSGTLFDRDLLDTITQSPELFTIHEPQLQEAAQLGDREAFGLLVRHYHSPLLRYASVALMRSHLKSLAPDTVQTTYVNVLERLSLPDVKDRPLPRFPYFLLTLRHIIADIWKSWYISRTSLYDFGVTEPYGRASVPSALGSLAMSETPSEAERQRVETAVDAKAILRILLSQVNENRRRILGMRFLADRSEADIAKELGISVNTVNWAVRTAMLQIRRYARERGIATWR